jgi:hypothetical protein
MKLFKSLVNYFTQIIFTVNDIKLLWKSCQTGDLATVENLLTNKKLFLFEVPVKEIFNDTCRAKHLNIIKYLLTSPHAKIFHNAHMKDDKWIEYLCHRTNSLPVLEYLLTSPDLEQHPNLSSDTKAIKAAIDSLQMNLVKFLISSPNLKHHVDPHACQDIVFKTAFNSNNLHFLRELIFELNINKTQEIENFIAEIKNRENYGKTNFYGFSLKETMESVEDMFSIRDLKNTLQSELNCDKIHKSNSKKHKI